MGFSRILAEFAEKMCLTENPPEKNTASRKSAEKVGQPAEYNKKIVVVVSQSNRNFDHFRRSRIRRGIVVS